MIERGAQPMRVCADRGCPTTRVRSWQRRSRRQCEPHLQSRDARPCVQSRAASMSRADLFEETQKQKKKEITAKRGRLLLTSTATTNYTPAPFYLLPHFILVRDARVPGRTRIGAASTAAHRRSLSTLPSTPSIQRKYPPLGRQTVATCQQERG